MIWPACFQLKDQSFQRMGQMSVCCMFTGGYAQRIFVKQVTKVLEDLLAALKTQE